MADTAQAPVDTGGLTLADFNQLRSMQTAPPAGKITMSTPVSTDAPADTGGLSQEDFKQLQSLQLQTLNVSKTGQSVEPVSGYQPWIQSISNDMGRGMNGITDDLNGLATFMGLQSEEDMHKLSASLPLAQAQTHPEDWSNGHVFPQLIQTMGQEVVSSIPAAGVTGLGMLGTGLTAMALGASAPAIGSAVLIGGALTGGGLVVGGIYKSLIQNKVSPTNARIGAAAAGAVATGVGMINLGAGGHLAGSVAKDVIQSAPIKAAMARAATKYFAATGINIGLGEAQGFINSAIKYIATRIDQGSEKYTTKNWREDFEATTKNVFSTAPVFTAGAEAIGAGIGMASKGYQAQLRDMAARFDVATTELEMKAQAQNAEQVESRVTNKAKIKLQGRAEEREAALARDQKDQTLAQQMQVAQLKVAAAEDRVIEHTSEAMKQRDLAQPRTETTTEYEPPAGDQHIYHGSSSRVVIDEGYYDDAKNLYGPGFYTTDNLTVAHGYTKKGRGKEPTVYKAEWAHSDRQPKLIDLDQPPTPDVKKALQGMLDEGNPYLPDDLDQPVKDIYNDMKENMGQDGLTRSDAWEVEQGLAEELHKAGYDGFAHVGGGKFKIRGQVLNHDPHQVRIFFNPHSDIKITELQPKITETQTVDQEAQAKFQEAAKLANDANREAIDARKEYEDAKRMYDTAQNEMPARKAPTDMRAAHKMSLNEANAIRGQAPVDFSKGLTKLIDSIPPGADGSVNLTPIKNQLLTLLIEEAQGIKPVSTEPSENPEVNGLTKFMRRYSSGGVKGQMKVLAQDMPPDQQLTPELIGNLVHDVYNKVETANREALAQLDTTLVKATGTKPGQLRKLISKLNRNKVQFKFTRFGSKPEDPLVTYHGTETQLIQDLGWSMDPAMRSGLRNNGFTLYGDHPGGVNWEQAGLDSLSPEATKVLNGLVADYNDPKTIDPMVKAWGEKNGGRDLSVPDRYYGRGVRRVEKGVNDRDDFEEQLQNKIVAQAPLNATNNPVNTIERIPNDHPLIRTDAYMNAVINKYFAARMIHTWRAAEVLQVFNDPTLASILETKLGPEFLPNLKGAIEDSIHGPSYHGMTDLDRITNHFVGKFGIVKIANPLRIPMHAVQLINIVLAKNISPAKLVAGVADFMLHPKKNTATYLERDYTKNKYADGTKTFIGNIREHKPANTLRESLDQFMLQMTVTLGDIIGSAPAWHVVLKVEMANGLSYEDAAKAADIAVADTMFDSSPPQASNFNAGRIPIGGKVYKLSITKLIGIASQMPTKMWQMQIDAMRNAVNHPTADNYAKAGQVIMTVHIANAMFEALKTAWVSLTSKDDKRVMRSWLDLVTSLITGPTPVLEHLGISAAALQMRNWALGREDQPMDFKTYPEAVYNDVMELFKAWNHEAALGKEPMENPRVQKMFLKAFNETVTGLPEAPFNAAGVVMQQ